jgi:hypothetical protein
MGVRVRSAAREAMEADGGGEPGLPSLANQVGNLVRTAGAVLGHAVTTGQVKASEAEQARRLAICEVCPMFRPSDRRCGACGCHLSGKLALAASSCPLTPPKWGPEAADGSP